jgi:hypothetical protein
VDNSGDPHRWDHHTELSKQIREQAGAMLDTAQEHDAGQS